MKRVALAGLLALPLLLAGDRPETKSTKPPLDAAAPKKTATATFALG
jgi:hypothetical protein